MILRRIWVYSALVAAVLIGTLILLAAPRLHAPEQVHGVSFSTSHAESIGLDWQETFDALVDDLGVRRFRLAAYWSEIEPTAKGQYDFSNLDYQMDRIAEYDGQAIVAVGYKLPRWPECHIPSWGQELTTDEQRAHIIDLLPIIVDRYKDHPSLGMWQLENEPLLEFGNCPPADTATLAAEEELLRALDPSHPILITDSGELNSWIPAAAFGDQLGTTMYRTVFSGRTMRPFRYDYIFPAWLYRLKGRLVWLVHDKDVLISELQGEPWAARSFHEVSPEERRESLSPDRLKQLARFAKRTQFPEVYWWGAEYWYWEKTANNEPVFWDIAKGFFRDTETTKP